MRLAEEELLNTTIDIICGDVDREKLSDMVNLADAGNETANNLLESLMSDLSLSSNGYIGKNGKHKKGFVDYLETAIKQNARKQDECLYAFDQHMNEIKGVCEIIYYLIVTSFQTLSIKEILAVSLCLSLRKSLGNRGLTDSQIIEKAYWLFDEHVLSLHKNDYNLSDIIDVDNPGFIGSVMLTCLLFAGLILGSSDKDSEDVIVRCLFDKAPALRKSLKKWFGNKKEFRAFDGNKSIAKSDLVSICAEAKRQINENFGFIVDEHIDDIFEYRFIDFSQDPLGDGFTLDKLLRLTSKMDQSMNRKKLHDDYLVFLNTSREAMAEVIQRDMPWLNRSLVESADKLESDPMFCVGAGMCYIYGVYVEQDFEKAVRYLKLASEFSNADALHLLSLCYFHSLYLDYDAKKWGECLCLACRYGSQAAIDQWRDLEEHYNVVFGPWNRDASIDLRPVIDKRISSIEKERFIKETMAEISAWVVFDSEYVNDLSEIYSREGALKYVLEIRELIFSSDSVDMPASIFARKIADSLYGMARSKRPTPDGIRINYNLDYKGYKYGPAACWYLLAYSLGDESSILEAANCFSDGSVRRTVHSDEFFKNELLKGCPNKVLLAYAPTDKTFLEALSNNGHVFAKGLLICLYYRVGELEKCKAVGMDFVREASLDDKMVICDFVTRDNLLSKKTNIFDYIMGKSTELRLAENNSLKNHNVTLSQHKNGVTMKANVGSVIVMAVGAIFVMIGIGGFAGSIIGLGVVGLVVGLILFVCGAATLKK